MSEGAFYRVPTAAGSGSARYEDRIYEVIEAGTTAASQPAYDTTIGAVTTDGSATLKAHDSFADEFAGARAYAGVSATAETVLDVHRNGSPIGTITFGIGVSAGSFATAGGGAEDLRGGDRLAVINEDPADATLADLSITFLGKRT